MTSGVLFTGGVDKHVRLWDMRSGASKGKLTGSVSTVQYVDLSSDEKLLIGASSDNTIRLWNIESGRVVHTLTVSCMRLVKYCRCCNGRACMVRTRILLLPHRLTR